MVDVVVAGAGVVGVATAYAMARRGLSVALVDRNRGPALGASYANGAQLSYAYSDALGSPSLIKKLPSLAMGADPLFHLKGALDPGLIDWGLRFLAASTTAAHNASTLATLKLGLESQRAMHALLERHPIAFAHAVAGKMHLYFDPESLASAAKTVALKRRHGAVQQVLTAAEAIVIEPALGAAKGLVGVVYSPEDEVGDPHRFSEQLIEVLRRDYGVRTLFNVDVQDAEFAADAVTLVGTAGARVTGRTLVVALGIEAKGFLARQGVRVPLLPMKGYSFTASAGPRAPRVSITDTARKLVFCQLGGKIRVAGVAELGSRDLRVDPQRLAALVATARESLPGAADYSGIAGGWAGLRPMTPSSVPIIARPRERLIVNVGHGMLGWTLAMGSAERAADLLLGAGQF
ncbi:FAD-dependent oxidoreductase [Phenylobacterium hankyongense]|uniref:FAD-dependent oxidoreductase n=1 Tax=Phenylobacterium hankyongense TaxID=1813876 RepID=UPI001A9D55F2|nr:FAD-dependent oxidoreductase [Phenylobacterium hankyongense]